MLLRSSPAPAGRTAPTPIFGARCVCCDRDACGLTQNVTAQSHYQVRHGFDVPVCDACRDHAIRQGHHGAGIGSLLAIGIATVGLGVSYLGEGRDPNACTAAIVLGSLALIAGAVLLALAVRRDRRERAREGHHPWLSIGVAPGLTRVSTSNPSLVEELRRRNPGAQFAPTRSETKRVPRARAVAAAEPRTPEADANVARVVACITKNTPDQLAIARAMLAAGEVSATVVEQQLAELEAVLGRSDLRARLRGLDRR